ALSKYKLSLASLDALLDAGSAAVCPPSLDTGMVHDLSVKSKSSNSSSPSISSIATDQVNKPDSKQPTSKDVVSETPTIKDVIKEVSVCFKAKRVSEKSATGHSKRGVLPKQATSI